MRIILEHLHPECPMERSRRIERADHVPEPEDPVNRARQAVRRAQGPVNYRDLTGQPCPSPPDADDGPPARRARRGAAAAAAAEPPPAPQGPPQAYGPDHGAPSAPMPEPARPGKPRTSRPSRRWLRWMWTTSRRHPRVAPGTYSQAGHEAQLAE